MKKIISLLVVVCSVFISGGCVTTKPTEDISKNIVEKIGEIRVKAGDEYVLSTDLGLVNMTSTKIDLDNYMKKKIKVTGMFSGATLYVDKGELIK